MKPASGKLALIVKIDDSLKNDQFLQKKKKKKIEKQ
jgi:hypothetical protein